MLPKDPKGKQSDAVDKRSKLDEDKLQREKELAEQREKELAEQRKKDLEDLKKFSKDLKLKGKKRLEELKKKKKQKLRQEAERAEKQKQKLRQELEDAMKTLAELAKTAQTKETATDNSFPKLFDNNNIDALKERITQLETQLKRQGAIKPATHDPSTKPIQLDAVLGELQQVIQELADGQFVAKQQPGQQSHDVETHINELKEQIARLETLAQHHQSAHFEDSRTTEDILFQCRQDAKYEKIRKLASQVVIPKDRTKLVGILQKFAVKSKATGKPRDMYSPITIQAMADIEIDFCLLEIAQMTNHIDHVNAEKLHDEFFEKFNSQNFRFRPGDHHEKTVCRRVEDIHLKGRANRISQLSGFVAERARSANAKLETHKATRSRSAPVRVHGGQKDLLTAIEEILKSP